LMFSSINIFIYKNRFYFNFLGSICILLWTYLMNRNFVSILTTKSRMSKKY
jgi:hypothetical protein